MTKEKLEWIIKRLSYIVEMQRKGETVRSVYISKQKEKIVIDEEVHMVMKIMDEIIQQEEITCLKKIWMSIKTGEMDICIIQDNPIERTKYYMLKKAFVNKIYQCCICKGMVTYDDVLRAKIE